MATQQSALGEYVAMADAGITIRLDRSSRFYAPGEILSGSCFFEGVDQDAIEAIELSVLWTTTGKGDEDLGVHHFERLSLDSGDWIDPRSPRRFSTPLPQSPLSYEGIIVKIRWCVRLRVFLVGGRQLREETRFRLGSVAPPSPHHARAF